jgi:hypothetical protein
MTERFDERDRRYAEIANTAGFADLALLAPSARRALFRIAGAPKSPGPSSTWSGLCAPKTWPTG